MQRLEDEDIRVIFFGSCITDRCNRQSDIDICIQTKEDKEEDFFRAQKKIVYSLKNDKVDILWMNMLTNPKLRSEINKGVVMKDVK